MADQQFLDAHQYTNNGILRYEFIFGEGYISTGGKESTEAVVKGLDLKKGGHVIDVGCGIGGGNAYLADTFGVDVLGLDLSENVISIAQQRYGKRKDLTFRVADALTVSDVPEGKTDLVYSRDSILHIKEKVQLFKKFFTWCKPGGHVFITDYCCGPRDLWTMEFTDYVKARGYFLTTVQEYAEDLKAAGFEILRAEDKSGDFTKILNAEIERLNKRRSEFLQHFSDKDLDDLLEGWESKLKRVANGNHVWGHLYARKPL